MGQSKSTIHNSARTTQGQRRGHGDPSPRSAQTDRTEPSHGRGGCVDTGVPTREGETAGWMETLLGAPSGAANPASARVITGHLEGLDPEGRLLFVAEPGGAPALPVTIGVALSDGVLVRAARNQRRALVIRTSEAPPRLVLIGLLRERVTAAARDAAPGQLEVEVDGETVRLTAEHEIELRCGQASILLRRSGRVILRGTHVVTSSTGPLKIKGATVDIN